MLSERTIINGLILIAGMILGPYLIIMTLEINQMGLLAFGAVVFLFLVFFVIKDRIALCPLLAGFFSGSLNFLPMGLTPVELISLVVIFYYFIYYVALKRRPIEVGPLYILIPMLVIAAIVLFHDHKLGLKAMGGGGEEGSRPGLLILIAFIAYLCGINIPTSSVLFMWWLPWWCLFLTTVGAVPFILTTYFPSLAPYVYYVSGNVNITAYAESIGTASDVADVGRNGAFIGIGTTLQGILVAYRGINSWWRPSRWIIILLALCSLCGVAYGGYRNALASFVIITILGAICYIRWRVLIILPVLLLAPLAILIIQNDHPYGWQVMPTIQRSMSFVPGGNWDTDVLRSAESSNDFRHQISEVYIREYLAKSPWIGNGFTFDPSEPEGLDTMSRTAGVSDRGYYTIKAFIVSKNFHIGWISVYDAIGIIGSVAFVSLNLIMSWMAGRFVFGRDADIHAPLFPIKVWIFCNLVTGFIGYATTFGSFSQTFIGLCATATVLVHLQRLSTKETFQPVPSSPQVPLDLARRSDIFAPAGAPPRVG